ncbi:MAG: sensor histidine kinase [Chloroflexota bacterium]
MAHRMRLPIPLISAGRKILDVSLSEPIDENSVADGQRLEPGLLSAFRLLMVLPLAAGSLALVLNLIFFYFHPGSDFVPKIPVIPGLLFVSFHAAAFTYLSLPALRERLQWCFLPLGLFLASLGDICVYALIMLGNHEESVVRELLEKGAGSLYFLIIPLVLISWQYGYRPAMRYTITILVIELGIMAITLFQGQTNTWLRLELACQRTIIFLVVAYLVTRVIKSQRKQREAIYEANVRLQQYSTTLEQLAVSRERNRLSRELHDTLAHHMSGMILQLEGTKLLWNQDLAQAKRTLEESLETARSGLTETRRALKALRASPLEDLGLREAIRLLANSTAEQAGLSVDLSLPDVPIQTSPTIEQTIYRVVQEALTNVKRHANAKKLKIELDHHESQLSLLIQDDGRGFETKQINSEEHFGLHGMMERAETVGGQFTVQSTVGQGTRIQLLVPA